MRTGLETMAVLAALALAPVGAHEEESRTLAGHYEWSGPGHSGRVEAVFTPTGEGSWDVVFHFNFQGPHTYSGTAEGNLEDGKLTGKVSDERGTRRFSFRGRVKHGKFRGTHYEVTGGDRRRTGTLRMRPPQE